ncbi:hypothetical protein RND59_08700 [Vibrio ruber]|uniref:hypothetical protein n=1 Tax=Vibrio ruber TaxID=184755 RepID=UPI002892F4CB|nr:hypothetical protein [Vibrio ruber]WNJ94249.1 hypothetical protein RND59_08700 [Vibrio ruber]
MAVAIYAGSLCDTIQENSYFSNACGGYIELTQRSKPDGHTFRYQYDVCGRLLQSESFDNQDHPTGKSWYEYDAASRLTYAENGDAWIALAYSPAGQLVSENINGTELTHRYDAAGRRIQSSGTES